MTDIFVKQGAVARRFIRRVTAMSSAERGLIAMPDYNADPYLGPRLRVHDLVQLAGRDARDGSAGATTRMREFIARTERELEGAGVTEDLTVIALEAAKAILVWTMADAQPAARFVYQPFESVIPYESLLDRQPRSNS
jgi:hypothetical protein